MPLVTVSKILGHSSPAITAMIYAHAPDDQKAVPVASLGAVIYSYIVWRQRANRRAAP